MTVPAHLFRRAAAVLLFAAFMVAIVVTARLEGLASGSPKRRSDIVLQQAGDNKFFSLFCLRGFYFFVCFCLYSNKFYFTCYKCSCFNQFFIQ